MDYIFVKRTHVKRSSAHSKIETFVFQMRIHMQMRVRLNVRLAKRMAITKRAIDWTIEYLENEKKFASSLATEFTMLVRI